MLADVLRSLPRLALPIPTTCDTFFIHRRALSDFTSRQTSFKAPTSSRNPTASSSPPTSSRTSTSSKAPTSSRPPTSSRTPTSSRIPTSSKAPTSSGAPTPSTTEKIASYPRDPPPSKRLFIKGVHWLTSEKAVRRAFGKLGIVTKVEIARYDDGASRGIGFVEFEDVNDAVYAFEMHKKKPISFRARKIKVAYDASGQPRRPYLRPTVIIEPNDTLFVERVHYKAEVSDLEKIFEKYGELKRVKIVRDENGKSQGVAFVTYKELENTMKAHLAGTADRFMLFDYKLNVSYRDLSRRPKLPQKNSTL